MPTPSAVDDRLAEQKMIDVEARRNQLMKDMAQLRLQAEVSQLEGSLQSQDAASHASLPPYLVIDAPSVCDHLALIKQLAASSRFIVIVPLAVVDHLDILKKDNAGAREAIRWLEAECRKGNRYIRAQKPHEGLVVSQQLQKTLKRDKDALRFLQILDCCKYLAQQSPSCDLHSMVCLLTKTKINSPDVSIRTKDIILLAQREGLCMQSITEFHTKWKETSKNGKG
jgi:protein SMG5